MENKPIGNADAVLELLRRQAQLYAELETFAARQRTMVTREDTSPLLALLADRQRLSLELRRVAGELEPARRQWSRLIVMLSESQRVEAEELIQQSKDRLRRVIEGDEEDARLLSIRKSRVGADLRRFEGSAHALSAYGSAAMKPSACGLMDGCTA